jgi:hypothetical protein
MVLPKNSIAVGVYSPNGQIGLVAVVEVHGVLKKIVRESASIQWLVLVRLLLQ